MLTACASFRTPQQELAIAEAELDAGDRVHGCRRMENALTLLDVRDAARWDRLGSVADEADPDVASRAFDRAEALRWPDLRPESALPLALPVTGRWLVTQGNRGSYSHARLADRFSWDFQAVDGSGRTHVEGDESPPAFATFGAIVRAPADGVVERAEDGAADNMDGRRNIVRPAGNVVVLRLAGGEFAHFCHLQQGSVAVRPGQAVRRGDTLGRCGASGNAVEPHLHFVVRLGPTSQDWSVPVRFDGVRIERRGEVVDGGVPAEGDLVETAR